MCCVHDVQLTIERILEQVMQHNSINSASNNMQLAEHLILKVKETEMQQHFHTNNEQPLYTNNKQSLYTTNKQPYYADLASTYISLQLHCSYIATVEKFKEESNKSCIANCYTTSSYKTYPAEDLLTITNGNGIKYL